ncbi:MAG TPA: isochorismatase family protein [Streptosporangiaceae bacterium]|nr:isochorismatase family protein [Streptosporangiaceae bacterium]
MPLISRDDSVLIVVDLQPSFWGQRLDDADAHIAEAAASRAAWLAGAATALGIPAVVTEEDSEHNGPTASSMLAALAPGTPVFAKPVFGLAGCPDIVDAVQSTGRRTAILAGFETDVCVTHSAVGLADAGYRVAVAEDAVYSPFGAHAPGLARLRDLGVEVLRCKSIYYDWIRTLEAARAFEREHPGLADPPGFSL